MKRRADILPLGAAALSIGLFAAAGVALAQAQPSTPAPVEAKKATVEAPRCIDCHTELVEAFAGNPHARYSHKEGKPDPNAVCTSCHGDGTKHMEAGGDASLIQTFHGVAGAQRCLTCHETPAAEHVSIGAGIHANSAAVNCLSCHSVHKAAPKAEHLLVKVPGELCGGCHLTQAASFRNKPFSHRLNRGGMTCLDCHDPHNRKGMVVKLTPQGELPCLNCHAEKRGPFVFDHVTGSGGSCLSCHQPHGSNNPNSLLWAQVSQLCLSCHSQTGGPPTLGSQPPSFHNISLPRYRNCTTCHVAVHGSNLSPQLLK